MCLIWFVHSYITHKTREAADPAALDNWGQTPRSHLCTSACSTSSASVPPQIVLSAMVCLRAVFHYPASVSLPLQDWPHLNMPRHHLLLNGPLWSKCQTGKLLKKKCSHLLSWHFPPRPIPPLFPPSPCFLVAGDSTKGPVLPSLSAPFTAHTHTLCVCLCMCSTVCAYLHSHTS